MMFLLAVVLFRQSDEELRPGTQDPKPRYHSIADQAPELTRVVDADAVLEGLLDSVSTAPWAYAAIAGRCSS